MTRRRGSSGLSWRECANPACREELHRLQPWVWTRLCPSCRMAGGGGAILAGVVGFLLKLAGLI